MKNGCGCSKVIYEPFEFNIIDKPQLEYNYCALLPNTMDEDWNKLQLKIVCDFTNVIKQLECGIQPDIELILEEISLIYMNNCRYGVTKRVIATDPEEDNFLRHLNYLSEFATLEEKDLVLLNLGIYDTLQDIVTRTELTNTLQTARTEINEEIDNEVQTINNHINEINSLLNTKIGFVKQVDSMYYGFASEAMYNEWLNDGASLVSSLILGKWVSNTYVPQEFVITFDTRGGVPMSALTVTEGFSITLPTPQWIDNTMTFDGWYDNSLYSGLKYSGRFTPTRSMVLYAKWVQAAENSLIMYSFSTAQTSNYTSSITTTELIKGEDNSISTRLKYHYIPTNVKITVTKQEFTENGIETVVIGFYDNTDKVYKIEDSSLQDEIIQYN